MIDEKIFIVKNEERLKSVTCENNLFKTIEEMGIEITPEELLMLICLVGENESNVVNMENLLKKLSETTLSKSVVSETKKCEHEWKEEPRRYELLVYDCKNRNCDAVREVTE